MKALTVLQPWAHMIAVGDKLAENRTWHTSYRGLLAIHAGRSRTHLDRLEAGGWSDWPGVLLPQELTFGAIVAVAELWSCVPVEDLPPELAGHHWACGPYCWLLRDVVKLAEPIPCIGKQGLWTPPTIILPKKPS